MQGLSPLLKRICEYREVLFWLLLLGSWQFLMAPSGKNAVFGATGTAMFLAFAFRNLGRLRGLGLGYASWRPTTRARWLVAGASGFVAGAAVFGIGSASGLSMMLSSDWRLVLLQVTLGPVLEEVVFRGYLFALLKWLFQRLGANLALNWLTIVTAAVAFALVHLAQPGVSWMQLACITFTGALYGWIDHNFFAALEDELRGYELRKGTVQFPLTKPVPAKLINRIAKLRAAGIAVTAKKSLLGRGK
jgi:membrane protease YdiL (CAAX protease family)